MFYRMYTKADDRTYAIGWCKGDQADFAAIFYYIHIKRWEYVGPELKDIIVGYDPDEDWEWGFHILPEAAEKITKEQAEEICGFKIDESKLINELDKLLKKILKPDGSYKEEYYDLSKLEPLDI